MEKETGADTIEAADRVRKHQGYHEAEVTFGGEADLHKHYRGCKKNPGHTQFIPIQDFKIQHLPPDYRDNLVLDYIRAEADLTCRLSVRYTSESRPKFHPERPNVFYPFYRDSGSEWMRLGTGWVQFVCKYKNGMNCECEECSQSGTRTPKTEWAKVTIFTVCHVVFDSDEARHTICHFFFDAESTDINQCPSLKGIRVFEAEIMGNWCLMECVTHDMDLVDKLDKMYNHRQDLRGKVNEKYKPNLNTSCVPDPTSRLTVIISYPHGLNKQVTVGEWTHRQILTPPDHEGKPGLEIVDTIYRYNAATCPGSSGAPIILLPERGWWWWGHRHSHSEGGEENDNKSGVGKEGIPTRTEVM